MSNHLIYSPGKPQVCGHPPAWAFSVLEFHAWATMSGLILYIVFVWVFFFLSWNYFCNFLKDFLMFPINYCTWNSFETFNEQNCFGAAAVELRYLGICLRGAIRKGDTTLTPGEILMILTLASKDGEMACRPTGHLYSKPTPSQSSALGDSFDWEKIS